uniref:Uncharacterized protein n=1 Tax=Anas platyrhynchos platyrhynchos TaxID=8840 RepID=A0A493TUH9_ANAPP
MDIVERVLCVAQAIHSQFEHVKCCKHQCQRLVERIQILLEPVRILQAQPWWHISHHEEQMLKKLLQALEEAQKLVTKYSQASWIQKFLSARSSGEEFVWVNESLEDVAQGLSLLLQAEQKQAFLAAFQSKTCRRQDAEDLRDDRAFLDQVLASKCAFGLISLRSELGSPPQPSCGPVVSAGESPRALESRRETKHVPPTHLHACPLPGTEEPRDGAREIYMDRQCMEDKVDWMQSELSKIVRVMDSLKKVNVGKREDITEIERDQLTFYRHLQDTERYDLYEGEYLKYPVAIKTFKRPLTTDTTKVRDIFEKEIQTLKKFESPNILRMYGICIEEKGEGEAFVSPFCSPVG